MALQGDVAVLSSGEVGEIDVPLGLIMLLYEGEIGASRCVALAVSGVRPRDEYLAIRERLDIGEKELFVVRNLVATPVLDCGEYQLGRGDKIHLCHALEQVPVAPSGNEAVVVFFRGERGRSPCVATLVPNVRGSNVYQAAIDTAARNIGVACLIEGDPRRAKGLIIPVRDAGGAWAKPAGQAVKFGADE